MKKALWLPSWYPNRYDAFDGDFIQRHARAMAGHSEVTVIHVVKLKAGEAAIEPEKNKEGGLCEKVFYYSSPRSGFHLLDRFLSYRKYRSTYRKAILEHISENGLPSLVHVHVALRTGAIALWIQRKWKIPFLVTEHWTGYLPEADDRYDQLPAYHRNLLNRVFKKALFVTAVSSHLAAAMKKWFPFIQPRIIPNVVDPRIFFPAENKGPQNFQLIHVSNLTPQKNMKAILSALVELKKWFPDFTMQIYGPLQPALEERITEMGLQGMVFCKGEVRQTELAEAMRRSDALVLYSRFETFGCVLIEANAAGIPVVVSDLPVFREIVEEGKNGVFAKPDSPLELARMLQQLAEGRYTFDTGRMVKECLGRFSFSTVDKQFRDLYDRISPAIE
ncbi:MAG: glycosyltransferase [Chitinophagaceae bacterium]|nr:glycosyltransferase [Chitinophagaceae bacterium]